MRQGEEAAMQCLVCCLICGALYVVAYRACKPLVWPALYVVSYMLPYMWWLTEHVIAPDAEAFGLARLDVNRLRKWQCAIDRFWVCPICMIYICICICIYIYILGCRV